MNKILFLGVTGALFFNGLAIADTPASLLDVRQFVGVLEYKTDNKAPLKINIIPGNRVNAQISKINRGYSVSTNIGKINQISCKGDGQGQIFKINGEIYRYSDLPKIIATGTPRDGLRISNSLVIANVGDIGGASIQSFGCGNIVIGNVKHSVEISSNGSGNLRIGNIGENSMIHTTGSGDVKIGNVKKDLNLVINGAGDAEIGHVDGIANITVSGAGEVDINSAKSLVLNSNGAGDVEVHGGKGNVHAILNGAGDFKYNGVAIDPRIESFGVGEIKIHKTEPSK